MPVTIKDASRRTWPNGDTFKGRMMLDPDGPKGDMPVEGIFTWKSSGTQFQGTFLSGELLPHGSGCMTFSNGDTYTGIFIAGGGVAGPGVYKAATGAIYKGTFGRMRTGSDPPQTLPLEDTFLYKGLPKTKGMMPLAICEPPEEEDFPRDRPDHLMPLPLAHREIVTTLGVGEILYPDGRLWKGRIVRGEAVLESGVLSIPTAPPGVDAGGKPLVDTYTGEFGGHGIPHGKGRLEGGGADGGLWVGDFYDGLPHGRIRYHVNGEQYEGEVAAGKPHGVGSMRWPNGDVYEGGFRDGDVEGLGRYAYAEAGTSFEGFFLEGKPEGRGRLTAKDGGVFDGYWHKGKRCGVGVSWVAGGERQEAWYFEDRLCGTPRIFFGPNGRHRLPARIAQRVAGANLGTFCAHAVLAQARVDHIVRLDLSFVPGWLAAKARPAPSPPGEGKAAVAKAHLDICLEPPRESYLMPEAGAPVHQKKAVPPRVQPPLTQVPRVRLRLAAITEPTDDAVEPERQPPTRSVAIATKLQVAPLHDWYVPPRRVRDEASGKIKLAPAYTIRAAATTPYVKLRLSTLQLTGSANGETSVFVRARIQV